MVSRKKGSFGVKMLLTGIKIENMRSVAIQSTNENDER